MTVQKTRAGTARYQGPMAWARPSPIAMTKPRPEVMTSSQIVRQMPSAARGAYFGIQSQRSVNAHQRTSAAKSAIITIRCGRSQRRKAVMP